MGIVDLDFVTNTVVHELGHVFALGDEYETNQATDPDESTFPAETKLDNITQLGIVKTGNPADRTIDPDKVKWLALPRFRLVSQLVAATKPTPGSITVRIDPGEIDKWIPAFEQQLAVSLRKFTSDPARRQLPLRGTNPAEFQNDLKITSRPNANTGAITLSFTRGLPNPVPEFTVGSALYLPLLRGQTPALVVEDAVLAFLRSPPPAGHHALNTRHNPNVGFKDVETPRVIPGFAAPLNSHRVVGIYEGANHSSRGYYRPTGSCKMRDPAAADVAAAYCFVCQWLIVNAVDPGRHTLLDDWYPGGRHG